MGLAVLVMTVKKVRSPNIFSDMKMLIGKDGKMKWKENVFLNNIFVSWRNMNKKWFYERTENLENQELFLQEVTKPWIDTEEAFGSRYGELLK